MNAWANFSIAFLAERRRIRKSREIILNLFWEGTVGNLNFGIQAALEKIKHLTEINVASLESSRVSIKLIHIFEEVTCSPLENWVPT